jgi:ABC-type multidrug transport system ATPase subunit
MLALETRSLTKAYGHRHVVSNFNMHVPKGSVYGFVGKNGAGKSTVMKMVDHLVHPTSGCIYLFGQESAAKEQEIRGSRRSSRYEHARQPYVQGTRYRTGEPEGALPGDA